MEQKTNNDEMKLTLLKSINSNIFKISVVVTAFLYLSGIQYFHGYISYWRLNPNYYLSFHEAMVWGLNAYIGNLFNNDGFEWIGVVTFYGYIIVGLILITAINAYFIIYRQPRWLYYRLLIRKKDNRSKTRQRPLKNKVYKQKRQNRLKRWQTNSKLDKLTSFFMRNHLNVGFILLAPLIILLVSALAKHMGHTRAEVVHNNLKKSESTIIHRFQYGDHIKEELGSTLWCDSKNCGVYLEAEDKLYLIPINLIEIKISTIKALPKE